MQNYKLLQLFADGGDGGGASGVAPAGASEAAAPAMTQEARLEALGVPKDKLRRRAKAAPAAEQAVPSAGQVAAVADPAPVEGATKEETTRETAAPPRMSWEEIMADPEYNKKMQETIRSRLKDSKAAQQAMDQLGPALELLSRSYGLDPADREGLAKAITDDDRYYEERATELGVGVEVAKRLDTLERDKARREEADRASVERQKFQRHWVAMEQQAAELKKVYPNFDLRTELQNPVFRRMTAPDSGLRLEDAYYAVHRKELQAAAAEVTARTVAERMSASVQSNQRRPDEAGMVGQAPSVSSFDYTNLSKKQRADLKQRIRAAAARGEKLYPGQ